VLPLHVSQETSHGRHSFESVSWYFPVGQSATQFIPSNFSGRLHEVHLVDELKQVLQFEVQDSQEEVPVFKNCVLSQQVP
jgi:hypothetical protein